MHKLLELEVRNESSSHIVLETCPKLSAFRKLQIFQPLVMFSSLRRPSVQPCLLRSCRRNIASSAARRAEPGELEGADSSDAVFPEQRFEGDGGFEEPPRRMNSAEMLDVWLQGEGAKFKSPIRPNNWLGDHVVEFYPIVDCVID